MKILKTYLEEAIALVRSPGRTFTEMTSDYGYRISIQRTFFFIFVSFLFSELFSVKSTLLFFFLGGSVIDFLFRSLVPSILWTVFYSSVYTILFLASGTGVFYMIAKYSSGLSDLLRITTYVSRLSFLTTLVAMLNAVFASGWFGVLSIILFFSYSAYLIMNTLYYGLKCERKIAVLGSLVVAVLSAVLFNFKGERISGEFSRPTRPKLLTPEEEREKTQEAREIIEKLERERKEKGLEK